MTAFVSVGPGWGHAATRVSHEPARVAGRAADHWLLVLRRVAICIFVIMYLLRLMARWITEMASQTIGGQTCRTGTVIS